MPCGRPTNSDVDRGKMCETDGKKSGGTEDDDHARMIVLLLLLLLLLMMMMMMMIVMGMVMMMITGGKGTRGGSSKSCSTWDVHQISPGVFNIYPPRATSCGNDVCSTEPTQISCISCT